MAMALLMTGVVAGAMRVREKGRDYKIIDSHTKRKTCCLCFTVRSARRTIVHRTTLDRILAGEDTSDDEEMDVK